MRPVFAQALADGQRRPHRWRSGVRPRLVLELGARVRASCSSASRCCRSPRAGPERPEDISGAVVALALAGLVVGALITVTSRPSGRRSARRRSATALDRVRTGDLDVVVPVDDGGEVGMLQSGVNQMVAGLRERQRLADLFGRHVGTEVAERALAQGSGLEQRAARGVRAVRRPDRLHRAWPRCCAPDAVVETLNTFFGAVVRVVAAEGGWVNKFEGDGALCVFGAPASQPDHAARALRAARRAPRRAASARPGPSRARRGHRRVVRAGSSPATSAPSSATSTR